MARAAMTQALLPFVVGLALLSGGNATASWHQMPNGLYYHEECIHQFGDDFHVEEKRGEVSRIAFSSAGVQDLIMPPCPHSPRALPNVGVAGPSFDNSSVAAQVRYYSDWVAYAQTVHTTGLGSMTSMWKVPAEPKSKGPAPPLVESSIYLFNGLEDSHGQRGVADVILQPVLQYGRSGCLRNPLTWGAWYFTAYQVGMNGRAYCGRNVGPLKEGEDVVGVMTLTSAENNIWRVDATRPSNGEKSTHSVGLGDRVMDAAYVTLEGMLIYNCNAFPASGSVTFANSTLAGIDGKEVKGSWEKMVRHTECDQNVKIPRSSTDSIAIVWDAIKTDIVFV